MKVEEILSYYEYYQSLEKMMINTKQYVMPTKKNKKVYSDEFTKIILLCCSEIDSIFKMLCKYYKVKPKKKNSNYSIKEYHNAYLKFRNFISMNMSAIYHDKKLSTYLMIDPFDKFNSVQYEPLEWWMAYQDLKHDRIKYIEKGNLENAFSSLAALFLLINYAFNISLKEENFSQKLSSEYFIPCI